MLADPIPLIKADPRFGKLVTRPLELMRGTNRWSFHNKHGFRGEIRALSIPKTNNETRRLEIPDIVVWRLCPQLRKTLPVSIPWFTSVSRRPLVCHIPYYLLDPDTRSLFRIPARFSMSEAFSLFQGGYSTIVRIIMRVSY